MVWFLLYLDPSYFKFIVLLCFCCNLLQTILTDLTWLYDRMNRIVIFVGCWILVRQCPIKSLSFTCPSNHLPLCVPAGLSITKFSQDWIIGFFLIFVHSDSWSWYLVTDQARLLKKKIGILNLVCLDQSRAWNYLKLVH